MRTRAAFPRPPLWLSVVGVLAALTTLIPLFYILLRAFGDGLESLVDLLQRPRIPLLLGNTLLLGASVTLAATLIGVVSAFLLARFALPVRRMWIVFATIPLAIPSYLAAYGMLAAFPGIEGFWGSWMVLVAVTTPYVTLPVTATLRAGTTDFDELSRTLGKTRGQSLVAGTWHQIRGATLAGALLVFLYAIADFGGVALFRFPVLTTAIQQAYGASYDRNLAAVLSVILVTVALIIVFFERRARGRIALHTTSTRARLRLAPLSGCSSWLLGILLLPTVIGAVIPVTVMLLRMGDAVSWTQLDWGTLLSATLNTVFLSILGATIGLLLALPIGILSGRYHTRLVSLMETLGYLPLALPGIVVGLALVLFALSTVPILYQTAFLLACAYGLLFMPKAIGTLRNAVRAIPSSLTDVSASLGYTPRQRLISVYVPLTQTSVLVSWLLIAVTAMKELPATLMLRPTGMDTLATMLWAKTDVASYGAAAPYALMLVVVAAIPALLLARSDNSQEVKS